MTAGSVAVPTIIPLKAPHGSKYCIDSATRIEIRSETSNTLVFYTLNGSRPQPFQRSGKSFTFPFKESFALNTGKVTIKAVATSRDGSKQSSVVTKTFTVIEAVESSGESEDETMEPIRSPSPSQRLSLSAQLKHRLSMGSRQSLISSVGPSASEVGGVRPTSPVPSGFRPTSAPLTCSTRSLGQSTAISMDTSLSRPVTAERPKPICVHCKNPRSKDPRHVYCTHCGSRFPPLPKTTPKPPLQMAVCSRCRAHLPLDSTKCLVCEGTVLKPTAIPTISGQVDSIHQCKDRIVCLGCGTGNPPGQVNCVTCENLLDPDPPEDPPSPSHAPPPLPKPTTLRPISGSSYMMCGVCGRVNVSDARFCDWCGSKPECSQMAVMCALCSEPNDWHFRHCFACGGLIKAPLRPDVELASSMKMPAGVELDKNEWIPVVEVEHKGPEFKSIGTQTKGIFYPSARTITNQKGKEFTKKFIHASARDRMPQLHGYSPGRGLWRMQLEHLCSHLRAYSQGSLDFQNSIASAQLGKMSKAVAKEREGGRELSLQLTFALKQSSGAEPGDTSGSDGLARTVSTTSLRSAVSASSLQDVSETSGGEIDLMRSGASTPSTSRRGSGRARQRRRKAKTSTKILLAGETAKLASELAPSGQGRREVVEGYIKKGANVNAVDSGGVPLLSLATSSGHMDCISALIEGGACVNAHAKTTGNTALHEAVMKGPTRVPCIETLLGHSANARLRNKEGLTPCELAMRLNHDSIVTCFATYVGVGLLDKLSKHHPSLTL